MSSAIDEVYGILTPGTRQLVDDVWDDKYRYYKDGKSEEASILDTFRRVAHGVHTDPVHQVEMFDLMSGLYLLPAGRILSGAGTNKMVTLVNCFVSDTIQDSMRTHADRPGLGIMDALAAAAYTMQAGGGIGMDYSTIRPRDAIVYRVGAAASGPLAFMNMWDGMCRTIMSAGSRRGAMMATIRCDHPDLVTIIKAKHDKDVLRMFNISILITDEFMDAVRSGGTWKLHFHLPPAPLSNRKMLYREVVDGQERFVYEEWLARDLWDLILRSTYEYAEPGVIFVDRINKTNNLRYCETISCTNPCGEQPLPPRADCNLSAGNLARMVMNPFTDAAEVDYPLLRRVVRASVRSQDRVTDVTWYPNESQREEAMAKRRIGFGIMGLGNMLQQLRLRYGSEESVAKTEEVMRFIANEAYRMSAELAQELGPFPLFKNEWLDSPFVAKLDPDVQSLVREHGSRCGVLLTAAPTGTTAIVAGNVSGGLEPVFMRQYNRKVLQPDSSFQTFTVEDYGYSLYKKSQGYTDDRHTLPDYMATTENLTVDDHLNVQAAVQRWIDASVSKTINIPQTMPFDEFKQVYAKAYDMGLKGCTTYRPNEEVRGSVLSATKEETNNPKSPTTAEKALTIKSEPTRTLRPQRLHGSTYKLRWPNEEHAIYLTINDVEEEGSQRPYEIFLNSKDAAHSEWMTALMLTVSAVLRRRDDYLFIIDELKQVHSTQGGAFVGQRMIPSMVALIGYQIEAHCQEHGLLALPAASSMTMAICPECRTGSLKSQSGCLVCINCAYSTCG